MSVRRLYLLILAVAFTLSLGPQPRLLGDVSPIAGPYGWLMDLLPGLDALRAPSRFAIVVLLTLTVLAAFGTSHLLARQSGRVRILVAGGVMTALLLEAGVAARWPLKTMEPKDRVYDTAVHRWLASRPASAILELPIALHAMHVRDLTLTYQYATLYHGHTLLSGYSGYTSPLADLFQGRASPLSNPPEIPAVVSALRRLGVRFIVVHVNDYRRRSQARVIVTELRAAPGIGREHRVGDAVVFELAPEDRREGTTVPHREVARRHWKVVAAAGAQTLSALTDGRLDTCWQTGRGQQGDEWLDVSLHRSVDIAGIRLELGQRREEYPRSLTAEAIESDRVRQVLFDGPVLPQLAVGLVSEPVVAPIDLDLQKARVERLRLRQNGTAPLRQWSICELRVFERRSTARQSSRFRTDGP